MHVTVLPGLDGGAGLLEPFRAALPAHLSSGVVAYPPRERRSYRELEARVRARLGARPEPTVLVAESFSGPIGIRVAADPPAHLRGLVLVASFAEPPAPRWLRRLVVPSLLRAPPPRWSIRRFMLGADAPDALVDAVRDAIGAVAPEVLGARLRAALEVDACAELRRIRLPVLAIEGARDRLLRERRALARCRPSLEWRVIDAPHLVLQRRPREGARVVAELAGSLA